MINPVSLTPAEVTHAALAGVARQVQNIFRGRIDVDGCGLEEGWHVHINGAIGELAVAKALGRYWVGMGALGNLRARDVRGVQVRWASGDHHRLKIKGTDPPGDVFVLITGRPPAPLTLRGWLYGREAMSPEYWGDPTNSGRPAAYWVPQADLHPIDTLESEA